MLKFELSKEMITIIGKALGAQPHDMVAPIIAELQRQIDAQVIPAPKPPMTAPEPPMTVPKKRRK